MSWLTRLTAAMLLCAGAAATLRADVVVPAGTNLIAGRAVLLGTPEPGIRVDLLKEGGVLATTVTGPNGEFAFGPVLGGRYDVLASGVIKDKIRSSLPMPLFVEPAPAATTNVRVEILP